MKVCEVMTKSPACCSSDTNLGAAAEIMWNSNCGFLPILGSQEKVVGVLTDRDMCIAMATRNRLPGDITVQQVSSGVIYSCKSEDDINAALETMKEKGFAACQCSMPQARSQGVLSVDDLVLHADSEVRGSLSSGMLFRVSENYTSQLRQTRRKTASA